MRDLVSVVIVNYNTFDLTAACISSILQHTASVDYEIVVVDNASPKDDPDKFLEKFPTVKLVKSQVNGGFAAGNNLGIAHASGNIILLLNSDTYLLEDSIGITAAFLSAHPEASPVSCSLNYENGKYQHNIRRFRSVRNELLDIVRPLLYLLPYRKRATLMLNQYFRGDFDTPCDWVSGAFMMFRKELLQLLPEKKLDERFFMYGEDQLWCWQFRQAGYVSWGTAATSVVHIANASTEPSKQLALLRLIRKRELEIAALRMGKGVSYLLFCIVVTVKDGLRNFIQATILRLTGKKTW